MNRSQADRAFARVVLNSSRLTLPTRAPRTPNRRKERRSKDLLASPHCLIMLTWGRHQQSLFSTLMTSAHPSSEGCVGSMNPAPMHAEPADQEKPSQPLKRMERLRDSHLEPHGLTGLARCASVLGFALFDEAISAQIPFFCPHQLQDRISPPTTAQNITTRQAGCFHLTNNTKAIKSKQNSFPPTIPTRQSG